MISYSILEDEEIVIIEPSGKISRPDLDALTRDVDDLIKRAGMISGLIVHTRSFPRWRDLGAFLKDMKFVLAHQRGILRVASVTDSKLLYIVHQMAHHLLFPEVGHFPYGDKDAALRWIRDGRSSGRQARKGVTSSL